MDSDSIQDSIAFLLSMICRSQRNLIAEALTSLGLYAGQEMFSWQLWHEDGLTQSEIVDRICVQHPTVSKMLNRLEKAGLVTRHTDPQYSRTTAPPPIASQCQHRSQSLSASFFYCVT